MILQYTMVCNYTTIFRVQASPCTNHATKLCKWRHATTWMGNLMDLIWACEVHLRKLDTCARSWFLGYNNAQSAILILQNQIKIHVNFSLICSNSPIYPKSRCTIFYRAFWTQHTLYSFDMHIVGNPLKFFVFWW